MEGPSCPATKAPARGLIDGSDFIDTMSHRVGTLTIRESPLRIDHDDPDCSNHHSVSLRRINLGLAGDDGLVVLRSLPAASSAGHHHGTVSPRTRARPTIAL
jgi:hypothetical protein